MKLLLITWPSGSGKSTLQSNLIQHYSSIYSRVILTTTRSPRQDKNWIDIETRWQDYNFINAEKFHKNDMYISLQEWFHKYGLSKQEYCRLSWNDKINIMAWWLNFRQILGWITNIQLLIIFMNTWYEECGIRMKNSRWKDFDINSRNNLFEQESMSIESADITISQTLGIIEIHNQISRIMNLKHPYYF